MLLNIPPQKTLLRRHLTTNFNVLIGPEVQQEKREITESTAYTPLTTTAKVRVCYCFQKGDISEFQASSPLIKKRRDKHKQGEVFTFLLMPDTKASSLYLFKSASEICMQCLLSFLKSVVTPNLKTNVFSSELHTLGMKVWQ